MPAHTLGARVTRAALIALVGLTGCQNLSVENTNAPDVQTVFSNGTNLEGSVSTSFRTWWGVAQGARDNSADPVQSFASLGEEITASTGRAFELAQEPRIQYNNRDATQWFNRKPWYDLYECVATNTDALIAISRGTKVGLVNATTPDGADTPRARYFAKFMQGLCTTYVGVIFDRGFIRDESTPDKDAFTYELRPTSEVFTAGIAMLEESIRLMNAQPVQTLPLPWINGATVTNRDLARVAQSFIARLLAANARSATARQAVDWARVLRKIDSGVVAPFGQLASATITGTTSGYLQRTQLSQDARINTRLVGPADTSGAYQRWLTTPLSTRNAIDVATPDRRIHGAGGPLTRGTYFERLAAQQMNTAQGTYMFSNYRGVRFGTTYWNTGFISTLTPVEMRFLRAEALFRTGNRQGAADLINISRVAAGSLPPVTVDGPPRTPSCVPRKDDGSCGDLWDALMYEKRIETHATEAIIPFTDMRGWGRLLKGSMINLPVPGRELQTLGLDYYTFGGDLPGSAP
jgi:hypothetical protein